MDIIVIKKLKDADQVKFGDQVDIDEYVNYPNPPTELDEDTFDKRFNEAKSRELKVIERINKAVQKNSKKIKKA